jgi:DNA-binding MarR family transcriptional regulator
MAEGIVRLRAEILRRRPSEGESAGAELTTPQAIAVRTVVREGPIRVGALAEALGVTVATASRTVDALVAKGLVRRSQDPDDARAVRVYATPRGKREHEVRRARFVSALEQLMDDLSSDERRQLSESLESLSRLMAPHDRPR